MKHISTTATAIRKIKLAAKLIKSEQKLTAICIMRLESKITL